MPKTIVMYVQQKLYNINMHNVVFIIGLFLIIKELFNATLWFYRKCCRKTLRDESLEVDNDPKKGGARAEKLENSKSAGTIWISIRGDCYHSSRDCSGLADASGVNKRRPCLKCSKPTDKKQ